MTNLIALTSETAEPAANAATEAVDALAPDYADCLNPVRKVQENMYEMGTSDFDEPNNRLQIMAGGNGDYVIGTLNGGRLSLSPVQITGAFGGRKNQRVMLAVAELYHAMREAADNA